MATVQLTDVFLTEITSAIANIGSLETASHAPTICPILNNIVPTLQTTAADLVLSNDVMGGVPGAVGGQTRGWDPVTQKYYVEITPPGSGFNFTTGDLPADDFFVYGWACLAGADHHLVACEIFDQPIKFFGGRDDQTYALDVVRFYVDQSGIG